MRAHAGAARSVLSRTRAGAPSRVTLRPTQLSALLRFVGFQQFLQRTPLLWRSTAHNRHRRALFERLVVCWKGGLATGRQLHHVLAALPRDLPIPRARIRVLGFLLEHILQRSCSAWRVRRDLCLALTYRREKPPARLALHQNRSSRSRVSVTHRIHHRRARNLGNLQLGGSTEEADPLPGRGLVLRSEEAAAGRLGLGDAEEPITCLLRRRRRGRRRGCGRRRNLLAGGGAEEATAGLGGSAVLDRLRFGITEEAATNGFAMCRSRAPDSFRLRSCTEHISSSARFDVLGGLDGFVLVGVGLGRSTKQPTARPLECCTCDLLGSFCRHGDSKQASAGLHRRRCCEQGLGCGSCRFVGSNVGGSCEQAAPGRSRRVRRWCLRLLAGTVGTCQRRPSFRDGFCRHCSLRRRGSLTAVGGGGGKGMGRKRCCCSCECLLTLLEKALTDVELLLPAIQSRAPGLQLLVDDGLELWRQPGAKAQECRLHGRADKR
mmetsp:Transcript_81590/g.234441  ORF Transcript_81590/g.234441 Transcript_81590/m.234441 type:complete len:491 (-) Transcript_81590:46-1518(-)